MFGWKAGRLRPVPLTESRAYIINPGRGWYRIVSYDLAAETKALEAAGLPGNGAAAGEGAGSAIRGSLTDAGFSPVVLSAGGALQENPETQDVAVGMILLRVNIGGFRESPLSKAAIACLQDILRAWTEKDYQIIFRACYDTEGKGYEREPMTKSLVLTHLKQIGEAVSPFSDSVFVFQGLLVGAWGEMHSSRYMSDRSLAELYRTCRAALNPAIPIAVRTPKLWRDLAAAPGVDPVSEGLSFFNDGLLGSDTDLGTYWADKTGDGKVGTAWSREAETAFLSEKALTASLGGEAVKDAAFTPFAAADRYFSAIHLTYLNIGYDPAVIGAWKSETVKEKGPMRGMTAFDVIGARLGYRFVVTKAKLAKSGTEGALFDICLENRGYSPATFPVRAYLTAVDAENRAVVRSAGILLPEGGGQTGTFTVSGMLLKLAPGRQWDISFSLETDRGHRIRTGNEEGKYGVRIYSGEFS